MNSYTINQIFRVLSSLNKEPKIKLEYTNNFTLAVAVILSAQATDISVNKVVSQLFKIYTNPKEFLELGEENLKKFIKPIGLYNIKAKNIIALSRILFEKYNCNLPNKFKDLISLPGIGQKSANVILNCLFGVKAIGVDTHVARVSYRIGFTVETKPKKVEKDLLEKIPNIWLSHAHNWLILHGRYICKARKPECFKCPITHLCQYKNKNFNEKKK